jgi:hypothetical protein
MNRPQKISVIVSCFNEEAVLPEPFERLAAVATTLGVWIMRLFVLMIVRRIAPGRSFRSKIKNEVKHHRPRWVVRETHRIRCGRTD